MTHPRIIVLGRSEAEMLLRTPAGADVKAVISIHGQHEPPLNASEISRRLALRFDDAEALDLSNPLDAHRALIQRRQAAEDGRPLTAPTLEDARAIIEFAHQTADVKGSVLCQCLAGISRSPATALLCLATWTGAGNERYCVQRLLQVRPSARPLVGLVSLGDGVLGRGGKLVEAVLEARRHI